MTAPGTGDRHVTFVTLFNLTEVFWGIAGELSKKGVRCSFITTDAFWRDWLIDRGCEPADLLHLGVRPTEYEDPATQEAILADVARYEPAANLRLHEAMAMDSFARLRAPSEVLAYACMYWERIGVFLDEKQATHVVCEPTNLTELVTFLLCHKLGISYIVPRVARIPEGRFLLFGDPFEFDVLDVPGSPAPIDGRALLAENKASLSVPSYSRAPGAVRIMTAATALRSVANRIRRGRRWNRESLTYWPIGYRARFLLQRVTRAARLDRARYRAGDDVYKRRALYPLHVQPEASIDVQGSFFNDQYHLIKCFRQSLPADAELLVKEHPNFLGQKTAAFFHKVDRLPGVRLIRHDTDLELLMQRTDIVLTVSGTMGFQAALRGIPVVMLLPMYFSGLSMIRVCSDLPRLPQAIREALSAEQDHQRDARALQRILDVSHPGLWDHPLDMRDVMESANIADLANGISRALEVIQGPPQRPGRLVDRRGG